MAERGTGGSAQGIPPSEEAGDGVRVVFVTAPDVATGTELVRRVVEEGLAACGNVVPGLTSVFHWEGEVQEEAEVLLVLKTRVSHVELLRRRVVNLHPYDVPEFLVLAVESGHPPYLRWVAETVGRENGA